MIKKVIPFNDKRTTIYFKATWQYLERLVEKRHTILLIDEHVFSFHPNKFSNWKYIICPSGEKNKSLATLQATVTQLIKLGADRKSTLIGVGGGVVTDLAGFIGGMYMRGIAVGLVPTSLLAMIDAAIGGKNGINYGGYKNMLGLIRQPDFVLYDSGFLSTLPEKEWANGFAEIIKHACIRDRHLFSQLEKHTPESFQKNPMLLNKLIQKNVLLKMNIVRQDPSEQQERKCLNFGHTIGHAIELEKKISHGDAIAVGMTIAATLSRQYLQFRDTERIVALLKQYHLPTQIPFSFKKTMKHIEKDKKSAKGNIDFILLERIGEARIFPLSLSQLTTDLQQYLHVLHH